MGMSEEERDARSLALTDGLTWRGKPGLEKKCFQPISLVVNL